MIKLSLNKAAKEAGVAKATLLEALKSGRVSASKSEKGHWEIDPSELFRVFPKTGSENLQEPIATPHENHSKTSQNGALEVEVKMLREQLALVATEREREREQLGEQIQTLRDQMERQSADHRQALALLTDQRESRGAPPAKGFWSRLFSR
jgi:hypothetical protein